MPNNTTKGVEIDPSTTEPNYLESEGIEHPSESKPLEFEGDNLARERSSTNA